MNSYDNLEDAAKVVFIIRSDKRRKIILINPHNMQYVDIT